MLNGLNTSKTHRACLPPLANRKAAAVHLWPLKSTSPQRGQPTGTWTVTGTWDRTKGILLSSHPRPEEKNVFTGDTGRDWNTDGSNIQGTSCWCAKHSPQATAGVDWDKKEENPVRPVMSLCPYTSELRDDNSPGREENSYMDWRSKPWRAVSPSEGP